METVSSMHQLMEIRKQFCDERDWEQFHNAKDLAIGRSTEASELLQIFRFKSEQEVDQLLNDSIRRQEITEELADVFYFVLRFAQKYDIDLSEALINKVKKNHEKYPVHKAKDSNKKYSEL